MKKITSLKYNNKGETLVEIMVAFIVLMIVIAIFTTAVNASSNSLYRSIDERRKYDTGYTDLQKKIEAEVTPGENSLGTSITTSIAPENNLTGAAIELKAYKYESGDTVYWVYR